MAATLESVDSARNTLQEVPLSWLRPSSLNPRTRFDEAEIAELAASIKSHGMLEPIVVRDISDSMTDTGPFVPPYEIIAGHRRYLACKVADIVVVPIRNLGVVDDKTTLELMLVENLQRKDLDPIEEAEGFAQLNRVVGLKQAQIATAVHRSQESIANRMRLLQLPEAVQEQIRAGKLSPAHGLGLAKFAKFPELCAHLAERAIANSWTSKALEAPLPDGFGAYNSPLVKQFWDLRAWPIATCQKCPFDAYRHTERHGHVCLKPDHFAQLSLEAQVKQQAEIAASRAAATDSGEEVIPKEKLSRGTIRLIRTDRDAPEGCTEACPCRGLAEDYDGMVKACCTNPDQFDVLKLQQTRRQDEAHAAAKTALSEACAARLAVLDDVGPRELVLLAVFIVRNREPKGLNAIAKRLKIPLKFDAARIVSSDTRAALEKLPRPTLLRFAVAALLECDLKNWSGSWNTPELAQWYLAPEATPDA